MDIYKPKQLEKYSHFSLGTIKKISTVCGIEKNLFKPKGLWYSKGSEWAELVPLFGYNPNGFLKFSKYIISSPKFTIYNVCIKKYTQINKPINPEAILIISTLKDLDKFIDIYCGKTNNNICMVNWNKLCGDYGGIQFDNYHKIRNQLIKKLKLPLNVSDQIISDIIINNAKPKLPKQINRYLWYYTVDINSGCVWNKDIVSVKKITPFKKIRE